MYRKQYGPFRDNFRYRFWIGKKKNKNIFQPVPVGFCVIIVIIIFNRPAVIHVRLSTPHDDGFNCSRISGALKCFYPIADYWVPR